ncbi:MAG: SMP-30/gluconolactonase/LRE family protein [Verrucomicrobiae bacterium]|nr:SMP-30/gluconolactonase/LRE family protein [Verrucomicrobiae bacterium]MCP5540748.1 SMP-30/gluconolactonase/LRE family protein [Akkermansiaceae bacterium]MCP5551330.1 SMP-30/gluconolactonase/LRE family protein [Akkermansiaceae bacterium]
MIPKNSLLLSLLLAGWSAIGAFAQDAKWTSLFDGKSIDGWVQRGGEAKYTVEDGAIVGTTVPKTPNSFLCTPRDYGDFVLEVEFKVDPQMNSGIQFRSLSTPDYQNGRVHGYQAEIDPSNRGWSCGIYDEGRNGWLNDLRHNRAAQYAFKQNDWNHYRIEAIGNRLRTWINGVPAADLTDDTTASGFIALQVHGIGNREETMQVRWRNIRIQENPTPSPETPKATAPPSGPIVKEGAEIRKLGEGYTFTEGPALGPDGRVYFNDIPNERTHAHDPKTGKIEVFREPTGKANGLCWTPGQRLLACEGGARRVSQIDFDGTVTTLADNFEGKKLNSPNDLILDGAGGVYFTDPRYGKDNSDREIDVEAVYYLDNKGKLTRVAADLDKPNGIILSPDGSILYVADTGAEAIWAYDVTGDGKIENRRKFAANGSDGVTMDTAGNLYCTWKGEIIVLKPDGSEAARIPFPEAPANCLLVGHTLYATARTGFYALEVNAQGLR